MRFLKTGEGWPYLLVPFLPIAIVLDLAGASAVAIFFTSALGVIPTAALMGRATEELSARSGPGIGGLLNVTFGNAPELIIALFALGKGLHEVVKASLVGSILGNVLLVMGGAMLVGGLGRERQRFDRTAAGVQSSMLLLAAAAIAMPAIFELVEGRGLPVPGAERIHYDATVHGLSFAIAGVLILCYGAGLMFSLRSHRGLFNPPAEKDEVTPWSTRRSVLALALGGVAVGGMSEILVGSISAAAKSIGLLHRDRHDCGDDRGAAGRGAGRHPGQAVRLGRGGGQGGPVRRLGRGRLPQRRAAAGRRRPGHGHLSTSRRDQPRMGLLDGKRLLITGVITDASIAFAVA